MELPQVAQVWVVQQFMTLWNLSHGPTFTCSGLQSKTTTQSITVLTQSHSPSPLSCLAIWIYNLTVSERPNGKSPFPHELTCTLAQASTAPLHATASASFVLNSIKEKRQWWPWAQALMAEPKLSTSSISDPNFANNFWIFEDFCAFKFWLSILQKYHCAKGYAKQAKEWDCCAKFNTRATMQTTAHTIEYWCFQYMCATHKLFVCDVPCTFLALVKKSSCSMHTFRMSNNSSTATCHWQPFSKALITLAAEAAETLRNTSLDLWNILDKNIVEHLSIIVRPSCTIICDLARQDLVSQLLSAKIDASHIKGWYTSTLIQMSSVLGMLLLIVTGLISEFAESNSRCQ